MYSTFFEKNIGSIQRRRFYQMYWIQQWPAFHKNAGENERDLESVTIFFQGGYNPFVHGKIKFLKVGGVVQVTTPDGIVFPYSDGREMSFPRRTEFIKITFPLKPTSFEVVPFPNEDGLFPMIEMTFKNSDSSLQSYRYLLKGEASLRIGDRSYEQFAQEFGDNVITIDITETINPESNIVTVKQVLPIVISRDGIAGVSPVDVEEVNSIEDSIQNRFAGGLLTVDPHEIVTNNTPWSSRGRKNQNFRTRLAFTYDQPVYCIDLRLRHALDRGESTDTLPSKMQVWSGGVKQETLTITEYNLSQNIDSFDQMNKVITSMRAYESSTLPKVVDNHSDNDPPVEKPDYKPRTIDVVTALVVWFLSVPIVSVFATYMFTLLNTAAVALASLIVFHIVSALADITAANTAGAVTVLILAPVMYTAPVVGVCLTILASALFVKSVTSGDFFRMKTNLENWNPDALFGKNSDVRFFTSQKTKWARTTHVLGSKIENAFDNAQGGIKEFGESVKDGLKDFGIDIDVGKKKIDGEIEDIAEQVDGAFKDLGAGIDAKKNDIDDKFEEIGESVKDGLKDFGIDIDTGNKKVNDIGEDLREGLKNMFRKKPAKKRGGKLPLFRRR